MGEIRRWPVVAVVLAATAVLTGCEVAERAEDLERTIEVAQENLAILQVPPDGRPWTAREYAAVDRPVGDPAGTFSVRYTTAEPRTAVFGYYRREFRDRWTFDPVGASPRREPRLTGTRFGMLVEISAESHDRLTDVLVVVRPRP